MPRRLRDRGEELAGRKWVDENFDLKTEIRDKCGGILPIIPAFTTGNFQGSDKWSDECPPDILFYLQPPQSQFCDHELQHAIDEDAKIIMSPHKPEQELRAVPALPDHISLDVPGWQITAWRRLDPRIALQDIVDRMTTDLGDAQRYTEKQATLPKKNSLQNRCMRDCRRALRYYNDYGRRLEPHRAEVESMEVLTMNNILYNTTLQYHPEFHRLVKVRFVRKAEGCKFYVQPMEVTQENLEETTYPLDHFLFEGYIPELTDSMQEAIEMLLILQERAIRHGLNPSYWKKLARSCLPISWFDRIKTKTLPNETYDGGCDICTWSCAGDKAWNTVDFNKPPPRTPKSTKIKAEPDSEQLDSDSEQSQPEAADSTPMLRDLDDTPSECFTSSPEKIIFSRTKSHSLSISPPKRRRVDQQSPSPTKRRITAIQDAGQVEAATDGLVQVGAWSTEPMDPFLTEYNHGHLETSFATMPQTPPASATHGYGYFESSMSSGGYAAPHQIWSPIANEACAQDEYSPENLEARLRSSLHEFAEQRSQEYANGGAQLMPTVEPSLVAHDHPALVLEDPTLAAPFEMDESDQDFTTMLNWCRTLSQSTSQPPQPTQTAQPDALAAGIG